MSAPTPSGVRGNFCRFEDQRWGPGSDPWLRSHDAMWLQSMFPARGAGGRLLAAQGALWVRRIEGRWLVCHVCIPEWSSIRSTPAWAIAVVPDEAFRRVAILRSVVEDVCRAVQAPERWAAEPASWTVDPWDPMAIPKVAALFDVALRAPGGGNPGRFVFPESFLGAAGWIAVQQVLVAMVHSGVQSPSALVVREHGWGLPASAPGLDAGYEFRVDCPASAALPGQPMSRGVEIASFVTEFAACTDLLARLTAALKTGGDPADSFAQAAIPCVPLAAIDASRITRQELGPWANAIAATPDGPNAAAELVEKLVRRIERGEQGLVPPALRLLAAWHDRELAEGGPAATSHAGSRLMDWTERVVRSR